MRPFDINEIKVGDVLSCKDPALKVEILCKETDRNKIVGLLTGCHCGIDYRKRICFFNQNGVSNWSSIDGDDDFDLVLPEYTDSVDVYVYRGKLSNNKVRAFDYKLDPIQHNHLSFIKKVTIQI